MLAHCTLCKTTKHSDLGCACKYANRETYTSLYNLLEQYKYFPHESSSWSVFNGAQFRQCRIVTLHGHVFGAWTYYGLLKSICNYIDLCADTWTDKLNMSLENFYALGMRVKLQIFLRTTGWGFKFVASNNFGLLVDPENEKEWK